MQVAPEPSGTRADDRPGVDRDPGCVACSHHHEARQPPPRPL